MTLPSLAKKQLGFTAVPGAGGPTGQDMFQTSLASAWNTHFCLPVARSMATRLSLVPVAGGEVFSPVAV